MKVSGALPWATTAPEEVVCRTVTWPPQEEPTVYVLPATTPLMVL